MTEISYYLEQAYTTVLKRDEEGDIIATIAELDGCIAHGADEAEALRNLREAQAAWLEAAIHAGLDIPVPEVEEDLPSGKFVVRLPRSLHRKLNKLAKRDDVSLNQLVVMAATEHVARREGRQEMKAAYADLMAWKLPKPLPWNRSEQAMPETGEYFKQIKEQGVVASGGNAPDRHVRPLLPTRRRG